MTAKEKLQKLRAVKVLVLVGNVGHLVDNEAEKQVMDWYNAEGDTGMTFRGRMITKRSVVGIMPFTEYEKSKYISDKFAKLITDLKSDIVAEETEEYLGKPISPEESQTASKYATRLLNREKLIYKAVLQIHRNRIKAGKVISPIYEKDPKKAKALVYATNNIDFKYNSSYWQETLRDYEKV